ncbi:MAG: hypothetical protein ACRC1N_11580, partial [Aeromonas sobria]
MDIKPYSQQLAQSASNNRALATLNSAGGGQGGGWEEMVSLSTQRMTSQAQQVLTYEHLAKNSKLPPALDMSSDKG